MVGIAVCRYLADDIRQSWTLPLRTWLKTSCSHAWRRLARNSATLSSETAEWRVSSDNVAGRFDVATIGTGRPYPEIRQLQTTSSLRSIPAEEVVVGIVACGYYWKR